MKVSRKYWSKIWFPHYEGDGEGAGAGAGDGAGAGEGAGAGAGAGTGGEEKKYTQKEIDKMINARFKKERSENEKLLGQLQAIQQNGLTPEAKEELEQQITRLQESMQTKEQTLQQRMAESEKKLNKQIESVSGERDTWKNRYHKSMVERAILDAGVAAEAEDPTQLVLMFGPMSRLEEEVDGAGKGTGNFIPKMKIQGIDPETKKPALLDLPVGEAINHFKEHGLHKNLFKHKAASGTGKPGSGTGTGGGGSGSKMPERSQFGTEEEYSQAYQLWRNDHHADGTPIQRK
jgi:hypothetical protein